MTHISNLPGLAPARVASERGRLRSTSIPARYEVNVTSQKGDVVLRGEIRLNISSETLRAEVYTLLHDHMRQLLAKVETWL